MSNKPNYKTTRKYKCPYCDLKASRIDLIDHVGKSHKELIPENYTAARAVYDSINGKNYGICMACKQKVYKWNDKINRYYNLCDKPACRQKVRDIALDRHMRVYNKPTLLDDPEQQEKMLANRRISGTYIYSDGKKFIYTGKFEKNALEFMDKVLNIPSSDIQTPGPVLEYEYKGKIHKWITDIYYIPANLLIEIKDGGSNPNNRSMESYREKQVAKEVMITDKGTFNYIRLTNNNFAQLLDIFADMKNEALNNSNPKVKIHINEEVGGLPPQRPPEAYIVPYGMNNVFDGFAYTDSNIGNMILVDDEDNIVSMDKDTFHETYKTSPYLIYIESDINEKINKIHKIISEGKVSNKFCIVEALTGNKVRKIEDVIISECFKYYDEETEKMICKFIENSVQDQELSNSNVIKTIGNVFIHSGTNGYYVTTPSDFYLKSDEFSDLESLERSNIVSIMNDIYSANSVSKGELRDV